MTTRTSLHPSIEAAMGCLDLTLESELTLFRNRHSRAEDEARAEDDEQASEDGQSLPTESATPPVYPEAAKVFFHEDDTILEASMPSISNDLAAEASQLLEGSPEDEGSLEDLEDGDVAYEAAEESVNISLSDASDAEEVIPEGAIIPSKAMLPSDPSLSGSATLETYTDPALDDYLESSEALLKHLDTPAPSDQLDNSVSLKWFAWAAGATLVLSLVAAFFLQNVFRTPEPSTEEPPVPPTATQPPPDNADSATPTTDNATTVKSPDLSTEEFQSVKPGNLAELPTPQTNATPNSGPNSSSTSSGTNTSSGTSAAPNTTAGTNTAQAPTVPATGRQYYVVTEYVDEASLTAAKKVAPTAKVVNFTAGTRIQLQQFSDESTARTAAAEFRQKGLSIEILATALE